MKLKDRVILWYGLWPVSIVETTLSFSDETWIFFIEMPYFEAIVSKSIASLTVSMLSGRIFDNLSTSTLGIVRYSASSESLVSESASTCVRTDLYCLASARRVFVLLYCGFTNM